MLAKRRRDDKRLDIDSGVTILLLVDKNDSALETCLRSIQSSDYTNYDVVVIDGTFSKVASRMIAATTKSVGIESSYIYKLKTQKPVQQLWREAYMRSQRAKYVLTMTSDMRLLPGTLREAVHSITISPQVKYVELSPICGDSISLELCADHLQFASQNLVQTVRSLFLTTDSSQLYAGGLYDSTLLKTRHRQGYIEYRYGARAPIVVKSQTGLKYMKRHGGMTAGVFYVATMILFAICIWLAAMTNNDRPLIILWVGFMAWAGIAILLSEATNQKLKFHVTVSLFVLPYVYAVNLFIRLGSIIKLKAK